MSVRCVLATAAVAALAPAIASSAAPALDQTNIVSPAGNFAALFTSAGTPSTVTQTFAVGLAGQLARIDVVVDPRGTPTANLVLDVRATSGGLPAGPVLASASVAPFGGTNPRVTFDVSGAGLAVGPGDVLAFTLSSAAALGTDYLARAVPNNTYAAGQLTSSNGSFAAGAGWDAVFDTYVNVVPEPAAVGGALIPVVLLGRRRRVVPTGPR